MSIRFFITLFLTILATFLSGVSLALALPTKDWVRAESEHFIVISNTSEVNTRDYVRNLEKFHYILTVMHPGRFDDLPSPKFTLYLLSRSENLKQVWPDVESDVLGFVKQCPEAMLGFSVFEGDKIREAKNITKQFENVSQIILFHEYAHIFMLSRSEVNYPKWFMEGFAEFYGPTLIQKDEGIIGMAWSSRYRELTSSGGGISYKNVLSDNKIAIKKDINSFYAKSWLLTHYIFSDPERKKKFSDYIISRNSGEDPVVAFTRIYGIAERDIDKTMNAYLSKSMASQFHFKVMPTPQITVTLLQDVPEYLPLWDAAAQLCPSHEFGEKLINDIRSVATQQPDSQYVQRTLSLAEITVGDESKALKFYRNLIAENPNDADAHMRLGEALYYMAIHKNLEPNATFESQIKLAHSEFGKSYQINPVNALNLYYYSKTGSVGSTPSESILNAALEAHLLAPSNDAYAFQAADLLISADRQDEAVAVLQPIANNPHGGVRSQWVQEIIDAINHKATKFELRLLMERGPKKEEE